MNQKIAERLHWARFEATERARAVLDPLHLILNAILYLVIGYVVMTLVNSFGPEQARGDFNVDAALIIVLVGVVGDFVGMTPEARKSRADRARTRAGRSRNNAQ